MKFHKSRTATRSHLEGEEQYEKAFASGELRRVRVTPTDARRAESEAWQLLPLAEIRARDDDASEPLEVADITIPPRALLVDELTRHRNTHQLFVPVVGSFMAVAAESYQHDPDVPDPDSLVMAPVHPGEAFRVGVGTWHTLPYAFYGTAVGLSIMHREELDSYHDVRDLAACGWVATLGPRDPSNGV